MEIQLNILSIVPTNIPHSLLSNMYTKIYKKKKKHLIGFFLDILKKISEVFFGYRQILMQSVFINILKFYNVHKILG